MTPTTFSVDAASCLIQAEVELRNDEGAIGLRYGLREIRRHLHAIAVRAIEIDDEQLIALLMNLCVIVPAEDAESRKRVMEILAT